MLELVAEAKAQGLPEQRASAVLQVSSRSLQRWRRPAQPKPPAAPRPRPTNALTRAEAAAVISVIKSPAHADQSCRELALSLENAPEQAVSVSPVTIWRYQVALDCNGPRGRQTSQRHGPAPDTEWVTGPNKLWDWDVTVLRSGETGVFWYLYSLLDHFSRKAVAWLVDERQSSDLAQRLWDQGLVNEGRLDLPHSEWPQSLSDRGAPMRSHSTRHYFKKLGIGQLVQPAAARPMTRVMPPTAPLSNTPKQLPVYAAGRPIFDRVVWSARRPWAGRRDIRVCLSKHGRRVSQPGASD